MATRKNKVNTEIANDSSKSEATANVIQECQDNIVPFARNSDAANTIHVVPEFVISLNEARERIKLLQEFVSEFMIPGLDFGVIPGYSKPCLLKSGSEKLCDIFGFSKHINVVNRVENWYKGYFSYEVKATLISKRTGLIEAEGLGSCNSKEQKFRNQDSYSIINTLLKIAAKRALIDAVLSATRSSGIFTQDVEDICTSELKLNESPQYTSSSEAPATKKQLNELFAIVEKNSISIEQIKTLLSERYGVNESKQLTAAQALDFIAYLRA
ncbi:MAG TPA: hypothetical protein VEF53_10060 [Patescibacteria group bacterium]|nr:hypothetical protein [Patescibacteria group bacterium]